MLKRAPKSAAVTFSRLGAKKNVVSTLNPSGTFTIVSAPMEKGRRRRKLKIDLASGDFTLAGDIDIQVCVALSDASASPPPMGGAPSELGFDGHRAEDRRSVADVESVQVPRVAGVDLEYQ